MESFSGRSTRQPVPAPREAAPQPLRAPEPVAHRDSAHASRGGASKTPKVKKGLLWTIAAVVLGAAVLFAGYSGYNALVQGQLIDGGKCQAVFLTNNQVYFGKLSRVGAETYKLNKIFYLQASQTNAEDANNPQQTETAGSDVQLIKLGSEVHGPEDQMVIDKGQVLFYENLTKEGKVAQTIEEYYADKK